MSSTAQFTIEGTVSGGPSPYSDRGFDAVAGETLTFTLEDLPALDVQSVQYKVVTNSKGAGAFTFSDGGAPTVPTTPVTVVVPAGTSTFLLSCTVYGGFDASGQQVTDTRLRIVAVLSGAGMRKVAPAESTEYDPTYGWVDAINNILAAVPALVTAVAPGTVNAFGATVNTVFCSDGATAGGVWRSYLALGAFAATVGAIRLADTDELRWKNGATDTLGLYSEAGEVYLGDPSVNGADTWVRGGAASNVVLYARGANRVVLGAGINFTSAAAITATGNPTWDLGTAQVSCDLLDVDGALTIDAAGFIRFDGGAGFYPSIGRLRFPASTGTTELLGQRNATNTADFSLLRTDISNNRYFGELAYGSTYVDGALVVALRNAYHNPALYIGNGYTQLTPSILRFALVASNPVVGHEADATAAVVCDNTTYTAQSASNAAGGASAGRSGIAVLKAPDAGGHADNYDGCWALGDAPADVEAMEKGGFVGNAVTAPTLPPADGMFIYCDPTTGNLMAYGEDGTLTTLAIK